MRGGRTTTKASCAAAVVPVRAEPSVAAEQVTQLVSSEPVDVLETREGWARIVTAYDYPGWVREEALGPAVEGPWLERYGDDVLAEARAYLGAPYEWGGMTTAGIDCSGLVHMSFRRLGILVPRDSWQQEEAGLEIPENDLRPGDLACYDGHVAFWTGPGRLLHVSGRASVARVLEEPEPGELRAVFRSFRRLMRD